MQTTNKLPRRLWFALTCLFAIEAFGLILIAPDWRGGAEQGGINALAMFLIGGAVAFLLLARTRPGAAFWTRASRYLFAFAGGMAANVVLTWGMWAAGFPIDNGTVRRGLMGENYWLGPVLIIYAVLVWLAYRTGLRREDERARTAHTAR